MHDTALKPSEETLPALVMKISVGMSVIMLVGKVSAYWVSGSAAILSDAAESVIHGAATGFAFYSLWLSRQPASAEHPYGRGKIAYFSAGFEGALILCAAITIIVVAVRDLIVGPELQRLGIGLAITAVLCLLNLALGLALVRVGKRSNSLILIANGKHVLTDMWTSLGVIVGVAVVWQTNLLWLDPVVGILVGANIAWTAVGLLRNSAKGLLDAADPASVEAVLTCLEAAKKDGRIVDFHQLRLRNSDNTVWVEAHLLLPSELNVYEAHQRASSVEEAVNAKLEGYQVYMTTHVEPFPHHQGHPDDHAGMNDPLSG